MSLAVIQGSFVCWRPAWSCLIELSSLYPEHDRPMKGLGQDDLVNQDLIIDLRKEFGMTHDAFFMVLTDLDMKVKVSTPPSSECHRR